MPEWIIALVPQLGLVILFMWYQERYDERRIRTEKEIEEKRIAAAKENHVEWRAFLNERDVAFNAGLGRLAEEIKAQTNLTAGLQAVLIAHDTRSTEAVGDIRRIRERLARAGIGNVEDSPTPEGRQP